MIDWRTGPEGMDGLLARLGYSDLLATDTSDPGVADPRAIADLLSRSERAARDGDLRTGGSLAARAAYLSAAWDLPLSAGQAVLLLAQLALAARQSTAVTDALVLASGIIATLAGERGDTVIPALMATFAEVAVFVTLAGAQGTRIRQSLAPLWRFFGDEGNVVALAWTGLVLAQAATEGGDVAAGEQYLRLVLECRAKLTAQTADTGTGLFPRPQDGLIVNVMIVVATAYLAAKDADRAESWAEEATRLEARSPVAWLALASIQQELSHFEPALRSLDKAIALQPDQPAPYAAAASVLRSMGRLPEAVGRATAAIARGSDPALFLLRGQLHQEAGNHAAALADLARAGQPAPGDLAMASQILMLRVRSLVAMGDGQGALDAIAALAETQPQDSPVAPLCAMLAAQVLTSMGRLDQAVEQCTRWIEATPDDADSWLSRADCRLTLGDEAGAVADLREAATMSRDPEGALTRIEPLVTARPDDPSLLALRGFALGEAGHRDRAMADLDRAVALAPDDFETRMRRGLVRLRCDFDLQDWAEEPLDYQTIMDSVRDLAASASAMGGDALSAYVWLVDRVTADDSIRFIMTQLEVPGAIPAVLPAAAEPLRVWLESGALSAERHWREAIEGFTAAQQGLAALGFVCFASRIDLDIADCHIRLGQLQQARLLLDRWDIALSLHMSPWTPHLSASLDELYRSSLETRGKRPVTPEFEYLRVYPVGFLDIAHFHQLLDALVTRRLGDPQGALGKLGPPDEVSKLVDVAPRAWFDVATILRDGGQTEQALAIVEKALADAAFAAEDRARGENLRGTLLLLAHRPKDAEGAFRRSVRAARHLNDKYGAVVAQCNLASALVQRGRPKRALAELESVRDDVKLAPGQTRQNWHLLAATALAAVDRLDEAEAEAGEAVTLSEAILASLRTADLQTAWQGGSRDLYDFAVDIAMRAGHVGKALELVEMARSRAFLFQLASRVPEAVALPAATSPADATDVTLAVTALANRRRVLAGLLAAARQGGRLDPEVRSELQQIEVRAEDVTEEADMPAQATAATQDPAAGSRLSVSKLLNLLRATAADLDQAQRLQAATATAAGGSLAGTAPLTVEALQALLRDDPAAREPVTLVEMFATSNAIYLFGLAPDSRGPQGVRLDTKSTEAVLASFTAAVGSWVPPGARLCVVAHGALGSFPFHAVDVGDAPLGLRNPVFYAPSASILGVCTSRRSPRRRSGVVLADARVGSPAPILGAQALAVGSKLDERRVLLGSDANRVNLLAALSDLDAGLVHLGIHGRFEADDPNLSAVALADGWISAEELAGLGLHVDLVTLAACNSGRTGLIGDDEILGLTRSLLYAGVASVLVTDQAVEELPTALLLEYFYDHLLARGQAKVDALRAAQGELQATTVARALAYLTANAAAIGGDPVGDAHLLLTEAELHAEARAFEEADQRYAALQQRIADAPLAFPAALAQKADAGRARVQLMARTGRSADYDRTLFADPRYWGPFVLIGDWH